MTRFENATSLTDMLTVADAMTDGVLIISLVVTVYAVLYLSTMQYGKWKALMYTSFICGVLLAALNLAGLIAYWWIVLDGAFFAAGLFMTYHGKTSSGGI